MKNLFACIFVVVLLLTACNGEKQQTNSVSSDGKAVQLVITELNIPIKNSERIKAIEEIVANGILMTQKEVSEQEVPKGGLSVRMYLFDDEKTSDTYSSYFFRGNMFVKEVQNEKETIQCFRYAKKDSFNEIIDIYWENEAEQRAKWEKENK